MKNFKFHLFSILIFAYINCQSEPNPTDSINNKTGKFSFSFDIGTQYHSLLREHYFSMDTFYMDRTISFENWPGHVGKTYIPTFGFQTTFYCDYTFMKNFNIEYGLQLLFRQEKYLMNDDSLERNMVNDYNLRHFYPLDTLKSIKNSIFNILISLNGGYSIKRFGCFAGVKISTFTHTRSQETSINNYENYYNTSHLFNVYFIPSLKIKYLLFNKKNIISTYFAIDKHYWKYYDFLLGFEINLTH